MKMNKELWTIGRMLQWTEQYFRERGVESARLDGEVLLSHILKQERIYLYTHYDQPLTTEELDAYRPLVIARVKGLSVAAIIGKKEFMGLPFIVNQDVLIPRPDTEVIAEEVLQRLSSKGVSRILDVCTGSGAILFSLLHYASESTGVGLDISDKALVVAEKNRQNLDLKDRSILLESDLFTALENESETYKNSFDFLVSNPPYIRTDEMEHLAIEVKNEPALALEGGADGLDFYRRILKEAPKWVKVGGTVAVEIGINQELEVADIAKQIGVYSEVSYSKDLAGIVRVLLWTIKGCE